VSLRQLAYFVAVAQELHFARAASRLYVAAPSLSQQIAALERSLGVRLFERHSRKVELTEAGRALLPRAEQLLSDADRLRRDAAAHHAGEARRRLVVGLRPGGFGVLTGPLLSAIRAALRDLELAPRLLHYDGLATALADGSIDVLLTFRGPADADAATSKRSTPTTSSRSCPRAASSRTPGRSRPATCTSSRSPAARSCLPA
jgi:DNA-binding transcriptional LysR family regulator